MKSKFCGVSLVVGILLAGCLLVSGKRKIPKDKFFYDPDTDRNVSQLISSKGYPVEDHTVQTKDGFLLSMQHIAHGKSNGHLTGPRPAVILQHGLLSASSDFVINFPDQSLGFLLSDAGFDVWLGNIRGNTYSRRHLKYTPKMKEFWDYSFDEMGEYDLPAMIDHVLNQTKQKQVFYIGHSQGTTAAFALLSTKPEYNKKIKLFVALAPVATCGEMNSAIKYLVPFTSELDFLGELLGINEFMPSTALLKYLSEIVCETKEAYLCEDIMFLFFGSDSQQLNDTRIPVYAAHTPAGSSTKSIVHYAQLIASKEFRKFDYGKKGNMQHYNQTTAPNYDVSKITTPISLIWSLNDYLADPSDVGLLKKQLKTMVDDYCVPFPLFNHGDFVLAVDAKKLLNDHIIDLLQKYL